jgi:peptidylprolyl isomerase
VRKIQKLTLAILPILILTACSTDGGVESMTDQGQTSSSSLPAVTGDKGSKPNIAAPTGNAPTTLQKQDVIVGSGKEAVATSTLEVHYTLMAWSTKAVVESSWDSGRSATFPLSGVIAGWQQGIPGMKEGGRRLLVIPPDLGYGATGAGASIGPNETLVFVVDLIKVS